MKVVKVSIKQTKQPVKVMDLDIGSGYRQGAGGSLPDVDIDFQSDRRQEIKSYLEERYNVDGKQRVFSAGTYTTLKLKAVLKDIARVYRVPVNQVNYMTAMLGDGMDWAGLFKFAALPKPSSRKLAAFINKHPQVFEEIRSLMFQPRSASIHASAIIVTPDKRDGVDMECFDYTPIKKVDNLLVSEFDGYTIDTVGLLKNDVLATKELSKIQATLALVNEHYVAGVSFEEIINGDMDDHKAYRLLSDGFTQNVFQLSSKGMTKFLMDMRPSNIMDIIAANALYRPATIEAGSTEKYVDSKAGILAPTFLWGTHNALKDTFGLLTYQEQLMQISQDVGGFTLTEGVKLMKLVSKKKPEEIHKMKVSFMAGAEAKGCPTEEAEKIWEMIESGGSYLFNKCISGKETIHRPHGGKWVPTIEEMYKIKNDRYYAKSTGHSSLRDKYNRKGYGIGFSLNEENRLVKNTIVDIRDMGVRKTYKVTLDGGHSICVTDNHKHPTDRGIVRTDELNVGVDCMFLNVGHIPQDTTYRFTDKGHGNNTTYHSNENVYKFTQNSKKGHCGFIHTPDTEYVKLKTYKEKHMSDSCGKCGVAPTTRLEVHHINGDHSTSGIDFSNLATLCPSCHKKEHYKQGRTKMGERGLYTELKKVVSVEYIGEDHVYDVEMAAPYHTFTTGNGVVTCNSHATAYGVTAYVGSWLKANYPSAFYTVALQWADDKDIPALMSEMEQCSIAKIVHPDVNRSGAEFYTDYANDRIFWSLTRIKQVGVKAVDWIIEEREKNGEFTSLENFIHRVFKYKLKKYEYWDDPDDEEEAVRCPVNARHIRNMICSGCFDNIEGVKAVAERWRLINIAAKELGFVIKEEDFPAEKVGKHYFWSMMQVDLSGVGAIDYRRIYDNSEAKKSLRGKCSYTTLKDCHRDESDGKRVAVCANVIEVKEISYNDKKTGERKTFVKVQLQQNNDIMELVAWDEFYNTHKSVFNEMLNRIVILNAMVKYSDFSGMNGMQTYKTSSITLI